MIAAIFTRLTDQLALQVQILPDKFPRPLHLPRRIAGG